MTEIEKKYLIREDGQDFSAPALLKMYESVEALQKDILSKGVIINQGYMSEGKALELIERLDLDVKFEPKEARLREKGDITFFTLNGDGDVAREEFETEIDPETFAKYWPDTKGRRIEKVRMKMPYRGFVAELDVYTDRDLVVAEIEVPTEKDAEKLEPLGKDVTEDKKYKNKNLAK